MQELTVNQFLTAIVEWAGGFYVKDGFVCYEGDDSPVLINVGTKEGLPLRVYDDAMKGKKMEILNPIAEQLVQSHSDEWFYSRALDMKMGEHVKQMMIKTVKFAMDKDNDPPSEIIDAVAIVAKCADEKLIKEIEAVHAEDMCHIFYDKKSRTAQLQTEIFEESWLKKPERKKYRKRSIVAIHELFNLFLTTDNVNESYKHQATFPAAPKIDAVLHVFALASQAIELYSSIIFPDRPLNNDVIVPGVELIKELHKVCKWCTGTTKIKSKFKDTSRVDDEDTVGGGVPGVVDDSRAGRRRRMLNNGTTRVNGVPMPAGYNSEGSGVVSDSQFYDPWDGYDGNNRRNRGGFGGGVYGGRRRGSLLSGRRGRGRSAFGSGLGG